MKSVVLALMLGAAAPALAAGQGTTPSAAALFADATGAAKAAMMSDPGVALAKAREAAILAPAAGQGAQGLATARWLQSEALIRLNHADEAVKLIDQTLSQVSVAFPGTKLHADLLRSRASVATQRGEIQLGLTSLLKAYGIYRTLGEARSQAMVLQNLGSIYSNARDFPRALDYYAQANDVYSQDPALVLSSHNNRGNIFRESGDFKRAESEYRIALATARTMDSPMLAVRVETNIATALLLQGQTRQADALATTTLAQATGDAADWRPFLWGVRAQAAHERGDDQLAVRLFEKAFEGVDLKTSTLNYRDLHATARYAFAALGRDRDALAHLEAYKRLDDEAREVTSSTMSALMSARFDAANQRTRIAQLKVQTADSEQRLKTTVVLASGGALAAGSVLLAILFAFAATRRSRREISTANGQLTHASRHDALTGLANRAWFRERLAEAIVQEQRPGLLLIDLDRFKAVNDTLGHGAGDELLREVARRLHSAVGSTALPARLGGDEFAVLVPFADDNLAAVAAQLVEELGQVYDLEAGSVVIGATIGLARAPQDGNTVDVITRGADLALYAAKAAGRGRFARYEPWMQAEADERRQLEDDLRVALAENQFEIAYQPIVSAETSGIVAYEALLRWAHPTRGDVPPDLFIPIAEEARLINEIGAWVLRKACHEAAGWAEDIKVAVNLSALQLEAESLAGTVINALAASGLPAERLELEMTESVFLRQGPRTEAMLERLRSIGVSLALDDFGTGYSSLGYLQRASFSKIKIDRSFVQSATGGCKESIAIIRAIVTLAASLGMETTAEGIEHASETEAMRMLGCSQLQGFLFGRPECREDLEGINGAVRAA